MNEQEQRIVIAEACGWKFTRGSDGEYHTYEPFGEHVSSDWYGFSMAGVPDYLHDLNAMQKAIIDHICGDAELEKKFLKELNAIIEGYADSEDVPVICEWSMAQICGPCWALAMAFLRTIGKWCESGGAAQ